MAIISLQRCIYTNISEPTSHDGSTNVLLFGRYNVSFGQFSLLACLHLVNSTQYREQLLLMGKSLVLDK